MDAQVGGAPVALEAVKAAADAARTAPTSFAPSANPAASKATGGGLQGGSSSPQRASLPAREPKAQPTALTPSAAELENAAGESRISQGAAVRCVEAAYRTLVQNLDSAQEVSGAHPPAVIVSAVTHSAMCMT